MNLTNIKNEVERYMKKIMIITYIVGSLSIASALEIDSMKWTQDYEMLVNLNGGVESTIEGLDQNKNGVRDDVEYYVEHRYKDKPFQKTLFLEAAKKIQKIIALPKEATKDHIKLDNELLEIYTCRDYMLYKLEDKDIKTELKEKMIFKSKVLNTNKRLRAYIDHKKLLPFEDDGLSDETLEDRRVACQDRYKVLTNPDLVSSK